VEGGMATEACIVARWLTTAQVFVNSSGDDKKSLYIYGFGAKKVVDRPVNYILKIEKISTFIRTERKQFSTSPPFSTKSPPNFYLFRTLKVGAGFGQYKENIGC